MASRDADDAMELLMLDMVLKQSGGLASEIRRGATMDNLEDLVDGTGRWERKGVPHERRWWSTKAHKIPAAMFRSYFRLRCV